MRDALTTAVQSNPIRLFSDSPLASPARSSARYKAEMVEGEATGETIIEVKAARPAM